jgi:hypothetical protein
MNNKKKFRTIIIIDNFYNIKKQFVPNYFWQILILAYLLFLVNF